MIDLRDANSKVVGQTFDALSKKLREGNKKIPMEKYLIVFLFAGHGILKDGMQALLINEYDSKNRFYGLLKAEGKLRLWAEIYPNAYIIGIFACCR